ncbi:MAG: hypothetical protein ACYC8S_02115 [Minisyncoccota bacterium]
MSLQKIEKFLERFRNIVPTDRAVKQAAVAAVYDSLKITIPTESVVYHNQTLYFKTSPALKGEIFIHKKKILEYLKNSLGKDTPQNIL